MGWDRIMFALPSPGSLDPVEVDKVSRISLALDAQLELFHCIYDAGVARPGRFATRGAQEDIHEFVERRREQLEHSARRFRTRGVRVRTSIRWDYPTYEGIVRQVLRYKPSLLIVTSTRRGRAARLLFSRTDYKLIENCPCPALFLRTRRSYSDSDALVMAAVDPTHAHDKPASLDEEILNFADIICEAISGSSCYFTRAPRGMTPCV